MRYTGKLALKAIHEDEKLRLVVLNTFSPTTLTLRDVNVGELTTDHMVTYFTFQDPDGNALEVCQVQN